MKKRSYGKVLTVLAALSFLIACVEGFLFYEEYAQFGLFRVILTLQNSCKAFLFNPSLSAETVLSTLTGEISTFELYIGLAYVVAAFVAPLCTATALFVAAERFFRTRLRAWRIRRREGILVLGYNEDVKMLLKNQNWGEADSAPVVHVIANVDIPEKEELALMKQNVFFRRMDCIYASEESMRELFADIQSGRIQKIFLLEDAAMQNVSLYLRLCELTKQENLFAKDAVCCCRCGESYARELIGDYFDMEKPRLGLYLFDLAELRVRKTLERQPIWGNCFAADFAPDPALPAERFNAHILIAGFGSVGEQMLRQTINMAVAHSQSHILIDVVDLDALTKKDLFFSSLELDDVFCSESELRIGGADAEADGLLTVRFHDMDARENHFARFLRTAAKEMPFTYAAVCIKDLDVGIRCVSAIERCTADDQPFPIAVKLEASEQLANYLDKNDKTFGNVFSMGGVRPGDALCLGDIYSRETEQAARAYHEIYRQIYFGPAGEQSRAGKAWSELKLYQQEANRLLSYHTATKDYLLRSVDGRAARDVLCERLSAVGIQSEGERFTYEFPEEELLARIEGDPILLELMRTEHRRWCYAMLLGGWKRTKGAKNELRRQSPYICTWEALAKDVRKYDLLPALMMSR